MKENVESWKSRLEYGRRQMKETVTVTVTYIAWVQTLGWMGCDIGPNSSKCCRKSIYRQFDTLIFLIGTWLDINILAWSTFNFHTILFLSLFFSLSKLSRVSTTFNIRQLKNETVCGIIFGIMFTNNNVWKGHGTLPKKFIVSKVKLNWSRINFDFFWLRRGLIFF